MTLQTQSKLEALSEMFKAYQVMAEAHRRDIEASSERIAKLLAEVTSPRRYAPNTETGSDIPGGGAA